MTFLPGWTKRAPIVVDPSKVGTGGVAAFPMLVPMTLPDAVVAGLAYTDGRDLRFTLDDATLLSHELVSIDTTAKTIQAWVQVPSILSSAPTTIYAQFGNPAATMPSAASQQATWSGYGGRWHLDQASGILYDATANGNNCGAITGSYGNTAKVGTGIGVTAWAKQGNVSSSASLLTPNALTVSLWVYLNASADMGIICKGNEFANNGWSVWRQGNNAYFWIPGTTNATQTLTALGWHRLCCTYDKSNKIVYVDGVAGTGRAATIAIPDTGQTLRFGASGDAGPGWLAGNLLMDEISVESVARTAPWVTTEFNNQNVPGTFAAWGAVETKPQGGIRRFNTGLWAPGTNPGVM